ncbi:MAG TPA: hypothetical protein VM010_03790 [Chitinophagaceae bacterium]|nr:hypothetical protein [Chitinophagaceae bacterium]
MKKFLYTFLFLFLMHGAFAQDEGNPGKVRERMTEYIQKRLDLSKSEADRFAPVFSNYFNELRKTNQDNKGDKLVLQQKIADLRLRYRDQFKGIVGDKRSNDVFTYERDFISEVKQLREERQKNGKDKPQP